MSTLRGNLKSISLVDVIQLLHVNRKSGKLFVSEGRRAGVLYILARSLVQGHRSGLVSVAGVFIGLGAFTALAGSHGAK